MIWISTDGAKMPYQIIDPCQEYVQGTYLNHFWQIVDAET